MFFGMSAVLTNLVDLWRTILPTYEESRDNGNHLLSYVMFSIYWVLTEYMADYLGLFFMVGYYYYYYFFVFVFCLKKIN